MVVRKLSLMLGCLLETGREKGSDKDSTRDSTKGVKDPAEEKGHARGVVCASVKARKRREMCGRKRKGARTSGRAGGQLNRRRTTLDRGRCGSV
jgi:hypothetical protein